MSVRAVVQPGSTVRATSTNPARLIHANFRRTQPTNRLRPPSPPEDKKPEKLVFANLVFSKCHQPKQKGPNFISTYQLLTKPAGYKHYIS